MAQGRCLLFALVCLSLVIPPTLGRADMQTYGFSRITDSASTDVAAQFTVQVLSQKGDDAVLFRFLNVGPVASSICDVYFDGDGILADISAMQGGPGVSFSRYASPGDLPAGKGILPKFETTAGLSADADSPVAPNGVDPGEWLEILVALQKGQGFADVLSGFEAGTLRVGLHVQAIGNTGGSDSFVSHAPLPGAVLLGMLGLGYAGMKLRRYA